MMAVASLGRRLRSMGFEGPAYQGIRGKLRFVMESTLWRQEIVFVATRESFDAAGDFPGPPVELVRVDGFDALAPFAAEIESHYYPGYLDRWRGPFSWGERAVLALLDGKVAAYNFYQSGTPRGVPPYWGRLLADDMRTLRAAVMPPFRRHGVNRMMKRKLLRTFFDGGTTRVYAECYRNNVPSARSFMTAGYAPIGELRVVEARPLRNFVRWQPVGADVRTVPSVTGAGQEQAEA
jgi:RimJ/RimL family protein N-acetyltransferase